MSNEVGKSRRLCVRGGGFWCGTGVVLQIERSLLLPKQPFITTLCSANHIKTLVNKGTTLTLNALTCTYAHMHVFVCARAVQPATLSVECISGGQSYFSRHVSVIIIPALAHV